LGIELFVVVISVVIVSTFNRLGR